MLSKVKVIAVGTIQEALEHALDWTGKAALKKKVLSFK